MISAEDSRNYIYLRTLGFDVVNDVFAHNSWYFRNALVRANYSNLQRGITESTIYLERLFRNMLLGEEYNFLNRELHIDWDKQTDKTSQIQSANSALKFLPKCKNCTLEEIAVLRVVNNNPDATQKEIASAIGKSERTVKTLTINLQKKGFLSAPARNAMGNGRLSDEGTFVKITHRLFHWNRLPL